MTRKNKLIIITSALLVIAVIYLVKVNSHNSNIPHSIVKKAPFTILTPDKTLFPIQKGTITYSSEQGVLSYSVKTTQAVFSVSEQPIPDSFNDAPQIYPALLNKMHQYSEVSTVAGTVTLTHPDELKGGQTAVLRSSRGVLIFVRPSVNLQDQQWKDFFNSLEAE